MRRESFTVSRKLSFELVTGSGDVEVFSSGSDQVVVVELDGGPESAYTVELNGSDLLVRPPSKRSGKRRYASTDIKVQVPDGSVGIVRTGSGDVVVTTDLGELTVATASGDVRVAGGIAGDFEAKTASGNIKLRDVGRNVYVATASGDVLADTIGGDLRYNSASGDIRATAVEGIVELKSVSGDLAVEAATGHTVRARTVSGNVRLGIPAGRTVDLDMQSLSGDVINRLPKSPEDTTKRTSLAISVKTVSGNLKLEGA